MSTYKLEQANQKLFAVYQVIYADADIEMWYDWNARVDAAKISDQCFWILCDEERIGGAIISNETIMYPFLIAPFSDRTVFWKALLSCCVDIVTIEGVLQEDSNTLLTLGYQLDKVRQVMCWPSDVINPLVLPDAFSVKVLFDTLDAETIAKVMMKGYAGGFDHETFGTPDESDIINDVNYLMQFYEYKNLSIYIVDEKTQEIAGLCIAGSSKHIPLGFAEIAELCVLPKYRNKRLAEYMLRHVRAQTHAYAQVVKLYVSVGNYAENLYRKIGFYPGPQFAIMSKITI